MINVGVDIGTFHTVAVGVNGVEFTVPRRSIPSIALRSGSVPIVGFEASRQVNDLPVPLIQAPKLLLDINETDRRFVLEVIRRLGRLADDDLGLGAHSGTVVTVPPGWNLSQCDAMTEALRGTFPGVRFFHEPVALLVAAWWLARSHHDASFFAKLTHAREIVVCDWGAGTVDLSAIAVTGSAGRPEFRCLAERTSAEWGGTRIARGAVAAFQLAGNRLNVDVERAALFLQQSWSSGQASPIPLEALAPFATRFRQNAAYAIQSTVSELLRYCSNPAEVLFVMHGGPLESQELRDTFVEALAHIGIASARQLHIGANFIDGLQNRPQNLRREVLVALGASVFAARGRSLPEYQYQVNLRDAQGVEAHRVRLAVTSTTRGIQAVKPPYTGVDYSVEVQQMRGNEATPLRRELALHVRDEGLVLYRIGRAGVGFAEIQATEAIDLPKPTPFHDATTASVQMPEKSTRFDVCIEET